MAKNTQVNSPDIANLSQLENVLGVTMAKKTTINKTLTEKAQIMKKVNEAMHKLLIQEFPQYYKEIETDVIVTSKDKTTLESVKGYRLLIPKDDIKIGNETHTGYSVGKPTTYVDGINTNDCIYFKEVGSTKTK